MLRVLHIMQYEKYVSNEIRLWNTLDVENRYVSIWEPTNSTYCELMDRIEHIQENELFRIIQEGKTYDVVVFVSLPTSMYEFIVQIPENKIVIWLSVGCDVYYDDYPYRAVVPIKIYKPLTKRLVLTEERNLRPKKTLWQRMIYELAQIIHFQRTYKRRKAAKDDERLHLNLQAEALGRIDYISTVLDIEYELIRQNNAIRAKFFRYKFVGDGQPFDYAYWKIRDFDKTKYILLGNSSDASNNHFDILHILKQRHISTPIYAPLAYAGKGNYPKYIAKVIEENKSNVVQKEFMLKKEYDKILQTMRVGVFGHMRQQSLGNITALLLLGKKVFLYKDSIAYRHFQKAGAYVYTIENDLTQENVDTPLSTEQVQHNRMLFANDYANITAGVREDLKEMEKIVMQK